MFCFSDVDYSLAVYTFRANGVNVLLLTEQCECVLTDCELYMFDRFLQNLNEVERLGYTVF